MNNQPDSSTATQTWTPAPAGHAYSNRPCRLRSHALTIGLHALERIRAPAEPSP